MFIRSQDKKILTEIHDLEIDSANQIWGSGMLIGEYSTEEKAIKVMDMIQSAITGTRFEFTDIVRDCDLAGIEIHNVFNMPKDEEVE